MALTWAFDRPTVRDLSSLRAAALSGARAH
jgi:hypothetical protein